MLKHPSSIKEDYIHIFYIDFIKLEEFLFIRGPGQMTSVCATENGDIKSTI